MPTYRAIQRWVRDTYDFVPQTCWIAHVKEQEGLPLRAAPNRRGTARVKPCPPDKRAPILAALRYFRMLEA